MIVNIEERTELTKKACFCDYIINRMLSFVKYLRHSRLVIWGKWHDKLQHVSSYSYNIEIMIQMEMLHFLIDWIEGFYSYIFTFG